jgi:hypothetical protein
MRPRDENDRVSEDSETNQTTASSLSTIQVSIFLHLFKNTVQVVSLALMVTSSCVQVTFVGIATTRVASCHSDGTRILHPVSSV